MRHIGTEAPPSSGWRYVLPTAVVLCGSSMALLSTAMAHADEAKQITAQPMPPKPFEPAPYEIDQADSLVPAEAFAVYGIDPIITGPVPRAKRG